MHLKNIPSVSQEGFWEPGKADDGREMEIILQHGGTSLDHIALGKKFVARGIIRCETTRFESKANSKQEGAGFWLDPKYLYVLAQTVPG